VEYREEINMNKNAPQRNQHHKGRLPRKQSGTGQVGNTSSNRNSPLVDKGRLMAL